MTFDPKILARVARCFCFLPKTEVRAIMVYLLCQWAKGSQEVVYHPQVLDWVSRVIGAGGADPSASTKLALSHFMDALDTASLTSKMLSVNCIVPDNLIAATVPLIAVSGNSPYTNLGPFVDSDLTVNGITGDGATKCFDTGIVPSTFADVVDCGMTFYKSDDTGGGTIEECGCKSGANRFYLIPHDIGNTTKYMAFSSVLGEYAVGASLPSLPIPGNGYNSGNSISCGFLCADLHLYTASSTSAHSEIGSVLGLVGGVAPVLSIICLGKNDSGIINTTQATCSFFAVHLGLTEPESSSLFTAVQTMRTALGGGFV